MPSPPGLQNTWHPHRITSGPTRPATRSTIAGSRAMSRNTSFPRIPSGPLRRWAFTSCSGRRSGLSASRRSSASRSRPTASVDSRAWGITMPSRAYAARSSAVRRGDADATVAVLMRDLLPTVTSRDTPGVPPRPAEAHQASLRVRQGSQERPRRPTTGAAPLPTGRRRHRQGLELAKDGRGVDRARDQSLRVLLLAEAGDHPAVLRAEAVRLEARSHEARLRLQIVEEPRARLVELPPVVGSPGPGRLEGGIDGTHRPRMPVHDVALEHDQVVRREELASGGSGPARPRDSPRRGAGTVRPGRRDPRGSTPR